MKTPIKLSDEQREIFDIVESTNQHAFITGWAGTGKSTLLRYLQANSKKKIVICAPTGVAALNVGGQTVHSLFRLPVNALDVPNFRISTQLRQLLNSIDMLIIDEVSMLTSYLLDAIDFRLRTARRKMEDAFGGVQVVCFGDVFQLPPVRPRGEAEAKWLADNYTSLWFFDARVWKETPLNIHTLKTVHRQNDDNFKRLLQKVRYADISIQDLQVLNSYGMRRPVPQGIITLAATNQTVNEINLNALQSIDGQSFEFEAEITGKFATSSNYPADESLVVKIGAHVMFLRNDIDARWVNGTLGIVVGVQTEDKDTVIEVEGLDGELHMVEPVIWENIEYIYNAETKELSSKVVGRFKQFPLRLAWAVTIHKSQGQAYKDAIIDLGSRAFSPGQAYVALSRLISIDGLYFKRELKKRDIFIDSDVKKFMQEVNENKREGFVLN